jgi:hypothetical protein
MDLGALSVVKIPNLAKLSIIYASDMREEN